MQTLRRKKQLPFCQPPQPATGGRLFVGETWNSSPGRPTEEITVFEIHFLNWQRAFDEPSYLLIRRYSYCVNANLRVYPAFWRIWSW